jgi:hypothetical protein
VKAQLTKHRRSASPSDTTISCSSRSFIAACCTGP